MSERCCSSCGGELVEGVIISGTMWADSLTRFVPARFINDRTLFGRYRREIPTAAQACQRCGTVMLSVDPGTLERLMQEED